MNLTKTLLAIAVLLSLAPGVRAQDFLPYPGGVTLVTREMLEKLR